MEDKPTYQQAVQVETEDEARAYLECLIQSAMDATGDTYEHQYEIQRDNVVYFAAYYDVETRRRVERLYGAVHPIFGAAREMTIEEIMKIAEDRIRNDNE